MIEAADSEARRKAEERLKSRVLQLGMEQQKALIEAVAATVIRDKLVYPKAMVFAAADETEPGVQVTYFPDYGEPETVRVHPHALGQIADKSRPTRDDPVINRRYLWDLFKGQPWHRVLLADTLNTFYHMGDFRDRKKNPAKFLHRLVGEQLCGFLSRSFNRNLNTATSLKAFIESCALHGAGPIAGDTTLVRTRLKCVLPQVFEPVPGEFVAFGVHYSNSDFGDGTLNISNVVFRVNAVDMARNRYGSTTVMDSAYSRTHLGSVIKESDIELSDTTGSKEVETVNSAIRDVVKYQLNREAIEQTLEAIRIAHQHRIPWHTVQELLANVLGKKDAEMAKKFLEMSIEDLPPAGRDADGQPEATGWWLSNLVGWFAENEPDPTRRADLQDQAGAILAKATKGKT
jgi:hypothetical protein